MWWLSIAVVVYAIGFVGTYRHQIRYWWPRTEQTTTRRIAFNVAIRWIWMMPQWYYWGWTYRLGILDRFGC